MKFAAPTLAFAFALTFAPAFAGEKTEDQAKTDHVPSEATAKSEDAAQATSAQPVQAKPMQADQADQAKAAKAEEKRICRRVSMDMSSRRKEKVCLTKEQWVEFNRMG